MDTIDQSTGEVLPAKMPPEIAAAVVVVMAKAKQLGKDAQNKHGGYAYVSVDKFFESLGPIMAEAGIWLNIEEDSTEIKANDKSGNPWLFVRYELTLVHKSGAMAPPVHRAIAMPISGPQAYGAAQSYVQKQFLRALFQVPTGDKDADDAPTDGEPPARTTQAAAPLKPAAKSALADDGDRAAADSKRSMAEAKYKTIRQQIATAPHIQALDNVMKDAKDDLAFIKGVSETGYTQLMAMEQKRRDMLREQAEVPRTSDELPA